MTGRTVLDCKKDYYDISLEPSETGGTLSIVEKDDCDANIREADEDRYKLCTLTTNGSVTYSMKPDPWIPDRADKKKRMVIGRPKRDKAKAKQQRKSRKRNR
jgi:hypothetical protein